MKKPGLYIVLLFAIVTIALWALVNRPQIEPRWPDRVQGFAYSPYQANQSAVKGEYPTREQITHDFDLLQGKTLAVRTYGVDGTLGLIPELAQQHNINVTLGIWLDKDLTHNELEINKGIMLARTYKNIVRVVVGNEVLFRGDLSSDELIKYIERVRAAIKQPVSTAEPWDGWLKYPEMAPHVDFLTLHFLPYWEGLAVDSAIEQSFKRLQLVENRFPHKPIIIGEIGWPSHGRTRGAAVASEVNEALFLRRFLAWAEHKNYVYYLMEAFDQPWKSENEGAVGAYWGVYDASRQQKFEFTEPLVRTPQWQLLAAISVALAIVMLAWFYRHSGTLKNRGRSFLALIVYATSALMTWIIYSYAQQYQTFTSVAVGVFLFLGMLGVIAVLLAEAHEWAEAHWVSLRQRLLINPSTKILNSSYLPKVSIHVPAYNEPPQMLIDSLNALAALDYPNYEVLVIDNNTKDPAIWQPVQAHCEKLGERFRFFHLDPLPGFKAGALNFALQQTDPAAEVVGVIDSDYQVKTNWLRDLVPVLQDEKIAIVQAPQDYRDYDQNAFKAMCHAEYRGFFHIGMITRNERNAIIQHGTMTLIRRSILEQLNGWAQWCITEDAELGLRVFEEGLEATYISDSYGRGLMPDTFIDLKKQRFRWAYGAMQILRAHASALLWGKDVKLTAGQRYHFLAGWLPWISDGLSLVLTLGIVIWSTLMIASPAKFDAPLALFSALPLSLFAFKVAKLLHLYRVRVGANARQTIAACLTGLALSYTIGIAILKGLFTRDEPFFRTPKNADKQSIWGALAACQIEAILGCTLLSGAFFVAQIPHVTLSIGPDMHIWITMMVVQSVPYLSAVLVSLISCWQLPARLIGQGYREVVEDGNSVSTTAPETNS